jgi:ribose 5-phosphate isomerase B
MSRYADIPGLRVAVGSDEATTVTGAVLDHLRRRGLDPLTVGPLCGGNGSWVDVAAQVAGAVSADDADLGILLCYTGTGVSIAANKIVGVRAALCVDAATATGARRWNDANVLVMGYRLTSNTVAREIIDAFLAGEPDPAEQAHLAQLRSLDTARRTT